MDSTRREFLKNISLISGDTWHAESALFVVLLKDHF